MNRMTALARDANIARLRTPVNSESELRKVINDHFTAIGEVCYVMDGLGLLNGHSMEAPAYQELMNLLQRLRHQASEIVRCYEAEGRVIGDARWRAYLDRELAGGQFGSSINP